MIEFLSSLDAELVLAITAIVAGYAAAVSTGLLVLEYFRWRREKRSVFALLDVDPPLRAYAHWDPQLLQLSMWSGKARNEGGRLRHDLLRTLEVGLTNIGSGTARGIEVRFLFQCYDLREWIERSGVFRDVAAVVTDDVVALTSERVVEDTGPAIDRRTTRIRYSIEGRGVVRMLGPTTSDIQNWQTKVEVPQTVTNAVLLYCVSSFAEITKKEVGSVGTRKEVLSSGSVRDPGLPPSRDSWQDYRHEMPSMIVELRYSDDFGNTSQKAFELPGTFVCYPNLALVIREGRQPPQMTIQFEFTRAQEIQP